MLNVSLNGQALVKDLGILVLNRELRNQVEAMTANQTKKGCFENTRLVTTQDETLITREQPWFLS